MNALKILAYSLLALALVLILVGCSGLTVGPTIERKAIIVKAGTAIEVLEEVTVDAHLLKEGETDVFKQDIGGWITMHPDHWASLKKEVKRLRKKCGEDKEEGN